VVFLLYFNFIENLPDPGKAQDFVKKFNQVLGDDEKLRSQLELLISPTCSCKQADVCVVSKLYVYLFSHSSFIQMFFKVFLHTVNLTKL
jgi:hypothetical protein